MFYKPPKDLLLFQPSIRKFVQERFISLNRFLCEPLICRNALNATKYYVKFIKEFSDQRNPLELFLGLLQALFGKPLQYKSL